MILASQNLEDYNLPNCKSYTKPLFSIPRSSFLFNAGNIDAKFYMIAANDEGEYNLIRYPQKLISV